MKSQMPQKDSMAHNHKACDVKQHFHNLEPVLFCLAEAEIGGS